MKKRIIASLLVGVMLLGGCGTTKATSTDTTKLESQVAELKKENETLKAENEKLKGSSSESTDVSLTTEQASADTSKATNSEEDYIKQYVSLTGAKVGKCEGYDGTQVGLSGFTVKNNGDKEITDVTLTVYFQDADGKDVFDQAFQVVGDSYQSGVPETLKPNYSYKLEDDTFYTIEGIADDIDITKYRVEVSKINFV